MENNEIIKWALASGTVVLSFFLGKSGVVKKFFDNRLKRVERRQKREEEDLFECKEENDKLHIMVDALNIKVSTLEKKLAVTMQTQNILLAYLKKIQPNGDAFIDTLIAQIKDLEK